MSAELISASWCSMLVGLAAAGIARRGWACVLAHGLTFGAMIDGTRAASAVPAAVWVAAVTSASLVAVLAPWSARKTGAGAAAAPGHPVPRVTLNCRSRRPRAGGAATVGRVLGACANVLMVLMVAQTGGHLSAVANHLTGSLPSTGGGQIGPRMAMGTMPTPGALGGGPLFLASIFIATFCPMVAAAMWASRQWRAVEAAETLAVGGGLLFMALSMG